MKISLIVAMDKNRVIGKDNAMPWHLPADLKHFKKITMGKPIVMGRKTFDSIGKPLPGRRNVVITRQQGLQIEGVEVCHSLDEALSLVADSEEVMIIGGAMIFNDALPMANCLHLTFIEHEFIGDTFFPEWDAGSWKQVRSEKHGPDENNPYACEFVTLLREKKA